MSKRRKLARHQQRPTPRPQRPRLSSLEAVVLHFHGLIHDLVTAERLISEYHQDPETLFDLRELVEFTNAGVEPLAEYLAELVEAEEIARNNVPLSTRYGTGGVWAGRQPPVMSCAWPNSPQRRRRRRPTWSDSATPSSRRRFSLAAARRQVGTGGRAPTRASGSRTGRERERTGRT
jgi:hypothetical protein